MLGPILFSIYNSLIGERIEKHNICYHLYADDGQLYLAFSPKDSLPQEEAQEKMMTCAKDVKSLLTFNKMKQKDDKTDFLIIGTPGQLKKGNFKDIHICEAELTLSEQVHNRGIICDKEMNSKAQINNISKVGYYHVKKAFVTSTLDYGNSLFYGLPYTKLRKLQMVQNVSARVLIQAKKYDRISMTAVRKNLCWLSIKARIDFKILVLAWKTYNGIGAKYLSDLLDKRYITHTTRSADTNVLKIPATKLVTCGDRAFHKAAPTLCNDLPTNLHNIESLASFKTKRKNHLFTKYYKT